MAKHQGKYWIISDTHFGHANVKEWCGRPDDFETKIMKFLETHVEPEDVLIHLGDVAFYNEAYWHRRIKESVYGKHWLVRGNHDKRSDWWYLNNGWDFVGEQLLLSRFKKLILFSHMPVKDWGYDVNIHGHFHNAPEERHEKELKDIKNPKHLLIKCEHEYKPQRLRDIMKPFMP